MPIKYHSLTHLYSAAVCWPPLEVTQSRPQPVRMSASNDGNHSNTDRLLHAFLFVQPPTVGETPHELLTSQTSFAHDFSVMNQQISPARLGLVPLRQVLLLEDGGGEVLVALRAKCCRVLGINNKSSCFPLKLLFIKFMWNVHYVFTKHKSFKAVLQTPEMLGIIGPVVEGVQVPAAGGFNTALLSTWRNDISKTAWVVIHWLRLHM